MKPLRLSLLPSVRANDESGSLQMEREGFVDEAAVLALISGPSRLRSAAYHEDLALAADDLDFAGWQLPAAPPARPAEFPPQVIDAIVRRATPPASEESGIGEPHSRHPPLVAGRVGRSVFHHAFFIAAAHTFIRARRSLSTLLMHLPCVTRAKPVQPLDMEAPEESAPALTDASTRQP